MKPEKHVDLTLVTSLPSQPQSGKPKIDPVVVCVGLKCG